MFGRRVNGLTIVSAAFLIFMIYQVFLDRSGGAINRPDQLPSAGGQVQRVQAATGGSQPDVNAVAAPYSEYILTQGPHGASYGHMAIDLTAGKGAAVLSPINGTVTDQYIDQWGNPTLVIENDRYRVLLLHGKYSVGVGDVLHIGDQVGVESNQGYTVDFQGVPCYNRDCGYHTHLNIYDKTLESNVNPLELISP
jgi:murein DD-endopeptidase MepM/ murein hydrolase activator NlpD